MTHHTPHRGFTLIELLVVIALIAILAAILFPVFAQARQKGRQTACLSNMRQIGLALQMYSQDFDETLPLRSDAVPNFADPSAPPNFLGSLLPYTRSNRIFACPSAVAAPGDQAPTATSDSSYLGNAVAMGRPLALIPRPADTVYLQELYNRRRVAFLRPAFDGKKYYYWHFARGPGQENYTTIHMEGGNLVFTDGHARWRRGQSLRSSDFGLVPDDDWRAPLEALYDAAF
jgi:prepilin-type N-terminal cleavage/methylation domain-containing protein/prepilin-type processing-associated H-X9-DG protein